MKQKSKRKIISKFTAVFLVVITLFSMFPIMSVDAAGQTVITLKQGTEFAYTSGWARTVVPMTADGKQVFCVEPDKPAPPNGTYRTDKGNLKEIKPTDSKYEMYNKALYYCSGGDGFNTSNSAFKTDTSKHKQVYSGNTPSAFMGNLKWNSTGSVYYTSCSGDNLHYMFTHLLVSYIQCGDSKYKSTMGTFIPQNGYYDLIKELYNAVKSAPNPPVSTKIYMLDIGDSYQQVIIIRNGIKLQLQKSTNNNRAQYTDLSGAKYNIYLDEACTDYFGYITTDSTGFGKYGAGENGVDVPVQTYYCKEVEAPKGFAVDNTVYKFSKTSNSADGSVIYKANCKDNPYIKLQLMKSSANPDITDNNDCYSLEGARYNIYTDSACTNYYGYISTDADGYGRYGNGTDTNTDTKDKDTVAYKKISGKNVELGYDIKFYAQEDKTSLPKGYDWDSTVYEFKDSGSVSSDGIRIFRAVNTDGNQPTDNPINDPVGIVLQKKNAVTGETTNQGLEGAIFEVQYYSQEIDKDYDVDTSKGDAEPTLDSANLKRTWYLQTDSDGYTDISDENYLVNNETYKSDNLYYEGGIVTIPLGTIIIKEVKEPDGYTKSSIVFYRRVTKELVDWAKDTNTPIEVPINEQPANGYIGIHKMNKSGQGVKGAVYGLYSNENATVLVSQLTTDADGKGTFNYAAKVNQTYYIKEISAPTGYSLDTTIYPVTPTIENATVDTAVVQDIYEDSVKGDIIIKKSSNDGIVSNLYFALSDNLGNTYNAVATDSTGTAKYTGLPVYDSSNNKIKYTVKELGFKTTPGTKSYGGFTWTVKAENCIKYKGAYYEGVANNTFSDCEYAYSRYYYGNSSEAIQNSNGYTKTLTANSSVTYNFNNTVKTTDIEISKQSYDGRKSGFWFKVVDQTGRIYGDIVTNENGIAKYSEQYSKPLYSCITVPNSSIALRLKYRVEELGFKNPGNGSYYLPDNYINNVVTDYKSDNLSTSASITFDVYNKPDTGNLNIVKSSDDGYIANLWFKVAAYINWADEDEEPDYESTYIGYDANGSEINEFYLQTDSSGKASSDSLVFYDSNGNQMTGLPVYVYGMTDYEITYKITELGLKASDGTYYLPNRYEKNEDVYFNLLENRSYTYMCHNSVKTGKLQIQKTSEDNIVENIWFKVESSLGYTANFVTDSTGFTDEITDLPIYVPATDDNELVTYKVTELGYSNGDGTYTLPSKYVTPKAQTVTLNTDDTVKVVKVTNTLKRGSVTLYKEDSDGNALTGSQWELYNASDDSSVSMKQTGNGIYQYNDNGKVVTLDTDNNGRLKVSNLKQGDYYFIEKTSPDGKMTYGRKIEFTISADSDETLNLTYTAVDDAIVMYDTGSNGNYSIYILGFTMLAISIAVAGVYIMNNTKKKHGTLN
ncbi:SpaA isopeptide-forming pilin-related protein [Ruminococcus sp.]|uniref:SpaA isopeptide-forming pilin-related protein n=1 Tax=Ruminococcus sp. TaxID=41978 RepID=UPI002622156D|nr:SpaA isopeptide-forming pilin-related protein [Ruminococcus sp.]MDD6988214.1 SpaA isopeptide-forming pilin-related protein [Ruminococcus sp.]MDY6201576.1 SpaA isopeptide-forming pilin-related protein [Ruminococcus sp.]